VTVARWRRLLGGRTRSPGTDGQPQFAITELSAVLAGGTAGGLQLFEKLTGSEGLWWRCCRDAAQGRHSWLVHSDHDEALRVIRDTELKDSRCAVWRAAEAAGLISRGLAAPAGSARPGSLLREVVVRAADCWDGSPAVLAAGGASLMPESAAASAVPSLRDRVGGVLACLDSVSTDARQAMVAICALLLAAARPDAGRVVRVPVVFARPGQGAVAPRGVAGTLELREFPPGPAGLFPDPRELRSRRTDPQFDAGLRLAWQFATGANRGGRCVLWRLSLDGGVPDYAIDGGSLGAAFAVALCELLRTSRGSRPAPLAVPRAFFTGLRPGCAITGVLASQRPSAYGQPASRTASGPWLDQVGDMDAKLEAAGAKRLRLVAPAANRASAQPRATVHVYWAQTIGQANRYVRRVRPVRTAITATALLAVIGTSTGVSAAVHFNGAARTARDQALAARDAASSALLASGSGASGEANATASAIKAIAAWGLDHTPQARYAMLAAAASPETATLGGNGGWVRSMAFSPAGPLLAIGDEGGAQLWNTVTGQASLLQAASSGIAAVAFSPGGKLLATGDGDGTVRLWNPATGRQVGPSIGLGSEGMVDLAFSPHGMILATAVQDGSARLWDVAGGRAVALPFGGAAVQGVFSLAFSPDGAMLATGDYDGTVRLWSLATGRQVMPAIRAAVPFAVSGDPAGGVPGLAFSPDGTTLATSDIRGTVRLWSLATGRQTGRTMSAGTGTFSSLAFSPDGGLLATADSDGSVRLWNAVTGQRISGSVSVGTAPVSSVAFSPDGATLATGGASDIVRLWGMTTATQAARSVDGGPLPPSSFAFGRTSATLATVDDNGTVLRWDTGTGRQTGRPVSLSSRQASAPAVVPDGPLVFGPAAATLAAAGNDNGTIRLWNALTGQQVGPAITPSPAAGTAAALAIGPNGTTLAIAGADGTVQVWDMTTRQPIGRPFRVTTQGVISMAFSPDGRTLADGDSSGAVRLWDVANGHQVGRTLNAGTGEVLSMAFSPGGRLLATGDGDGTARLWDTATGQQSGGPLSGGSAEVTSVAFSPDSTVLATGSYDGTARLWYVPTGQQIGAVKDAGPAGGVTVAFSPDGATLATTDGDGAAVLLWNVGYLTRTLQDLCAQVGSSSTPAGWAQYVPQPGLAYRSVCP
jgi:WD40 repeat protein